MDANKEALDSVLAITNGAPVANKSKQVANKKRKNGNDLITKVYPSDIIPDKRFDIKRDYRPNNFMNSESVLK